MMMNFSTVIKVSLMSLGLLFVVDSADRERLEDARQELENILTSDEMTGVPVEIIANKQDLPSKIALTDKLGLADMLGLVG